MKLVDISDKKKEYLKAKIDELETNFKVKNIRDFYRSIHDYKNGYQPRTNIVKDEKGDLVTDSHSILDSWWNHFSQLFYVRGVSDVRQTDRHTAEPLVLEPSAFEVEMVIEKLKRHKSPDIDQIPAELVKAWSRKIRYEIHKLINSIWNKEELLEEWKSRSLYLYIRRVIKKTAVVIQVYYFCQLREKFYPSCCQGLTPYAEEIIGEYQCGFRRNRSTIDHMLCLHQILEEK